MKNFKEFLKRHKMAAIIIVVFIFAFSGAVIGEIAAKSYLFKNGFFPFRDLDFSGNYPGKELVITNPRNVIVEQDIKAAETIGSVSRSLVGIYKKQKTANAGNVFKIENFYKINEPAGQGFVVSSDGWIVTSLALVNNYGEFVIITKDKKIYQIDRAAADTLTAFTLIHVQAADLSVIKLAESQSIKSGSLALAVNWLGLSLVSSVAGMKDAAGSVKSSDSFTKKIILNDPLPQEFKGALIFNLAGESLGLASDKLEIEPINHLAGAIKSLFKNKAILRPSLGISYVNLTDLAIIENKNNSWQKGAVIYNSQPGLAVKKNSPAERSGLKEGDIIISVDEVELDKNIDLTDIIQSLEPGEIINLAISRSGKEREIKVTIGGLK